MNPLDVGGTPNKPSYFDPKAKDGRPEQKPADWTPKPYPEKRNFVPKKSGDDR